MSATEKVKKKKLGKGTGGKIGVTHSTADEAKPSNSATGSVISVKEAATESKADTVSQPNVSGDVKHSDKTEVKTVNGDHEPASRPTSANRPRSAASLHPVKPTTEGDNKSIISTRSKEAWVDPEERPKSSRRSSSISRNAVAPEAIDKNNIISRRESTNGEIMSRSSSKTSFIVTDEQENVLSEAQREKEANAYVPYLYARNSLAKVVEDMKRMKGNHLRIVNDIENTYRAIENETQGQFNVFVLGMRTQYGNKLKTFRQVVEVHRIELSQKQQYWDEALLSLSARNQELLKDKKKLLIQNKVEYERVEQEKVNAVDSMTVQLDGNNSGLLIIKKQKEKLEEENQALKTENDQVKEENQNLKLELEELRNRPVIQQEQEIPVLASVGVIGGSKEKELEEALRKKKKVPTATLR